MVTCYESTAVSCSALLGFQPLLAQELRNDLLARCGRSPSAVILRVHRQGIDGNRATGNGSHTRDGTETCNSQSNGQCCCHLADANDMEVAMDLNDIYHHLLEEQVAQQSGALLVAIHATGMVVVDDMLELGDFGICQIWSHVHMAFLNVLVVDTSC